MRRRVRVVLAAAAGAVCAVSLAGAGVASAAGTPASGAVISAGIWHRALEVPGLAALNKGGSAGVSSVACGSAGNCAAVGSYADGSGHVQGFVVSEKNGSWRRVEVPGLAALNMGGSAGDFSVSCGSAGNCAAVGSYADGSGHFHGFVVSEKNGSWRRALEVPGLAALNKGGGISRVFSVACGSAGNCAAVGLYTDGSGHVQGFVVSEKNGSWRRAVEVPGLAALNKGGTAGVSSVACGSAGNCSAVGSYQDASGRFQGFVVSEKNGSWRRALEVPGLAALNKGGDAGVSSVACGSAGNCAAVGNYADGSYHLQPFLVSEKNGSWRRALVVPGLAALNKGEGALVFSVACGSAGNCAAVGHYTDGSGHGQGLVVGEKNGSWRRAFGVPGLAALNKGGNAQVTSVACASAGNCTAGGFYLDGSSRGQGFVVSEKNGSWRRALEVPGLAALNKGGDAFVYSVACGSAGNCAAVGHYTDRSGHGQAFVVSQT